MAWCFSVFLGWALAAASDGPRDPQTLLDARFKGAKIENVNVLLTAAESARVAKAAGAAVDDRVFSFFVARENGKIKGYAGLCTRKVRTKDQTAIYFLSPSGVLESIELVAFHEPPEYLPKPAWLAGFNNHASPESLKLGGPIRAVSGATMTAHSFLESAKIILAVWQMRFATDGATR